MKRTVSIGLFDFMTRKGRFTEVVHGEDLRGLNVIFANTPHPDSCAWCYDVKRRVSAAHERQEFETQEAI